MYIIVNEKNQIFNGMNTWGEDWVDIDLSDNYSVLIIKGMDEAIAIWKDLESIPSNRVVPLHKL